MFPLYDESKIQGYIPWITILIISVNLICFLFSFTNLQNTLAKFAFVPANFFQQKDVLPLFSSMFLHGGFGHLFGNMWFLWIFGNNLEKQLGRIKFLIFYILCGIGATLFYAIFTENPSIPIIGASGAISGILGGYFSRFPKNQIKTLIPGFFIFYIISIPAILFGGIWFLYQFLSLGSNLNIAFLAHIGGFLTGIAFMRSFPR